MANCVKVDGHSNPKMDWEKGHLHRNIPRREKGGKGRGMKVQKAADV